MKEVGLLAGVEIDDRHIAAAHKLPDSKNVKNRLIVKFIAELPRAAEHHG